MMTARRGRSVLILLFVIVMLMMSVITGPATASAKSIPKSIRVLVQGKEIKPHIAPVIIGGRIYVEFRSVVRALGFSYHYDAEERVITAESEDVAFRIDLNTNATYIDDVRYIWDHSAPESMIINRGGNTLVIGHLFNLTDYYEVNYYPEKKCVSIGDDSWGRPKKSDMRIIEAVIADYYRDVSQASSLQNVELVSGGTYATVSVDATVPASENVLAGYNEHASFEMERIENNGWSIHEVAVTERKYTDYKSLAQREADAPSADKSAILSLMQEAYKAFNEDNAVGYTGMIDPAAFHMEGMPSKEALQTYYKSLFERVSYEYTLEQATVVRYSPNMATVYIVVSHDRIGAGQPAARTYSLQEVVKASDGKWYLSVQNDAIILDRETF